MQAENLPAERAIDLGPEDRENSGIAARTEANQRSTLLLDRHSAGLPTIEQERSRPW
jgi:hypothetical protein